MPFLESGEKVEKDRQGEHRGAGCKELGTSKVMGWVSQGGIRGGHRVEGAEFILLLHTI